MGRTAAMVALLGAATSLVMINHAVAEERKFVVMLANSPKQFAGAPPTLVNPQLVREQYFDKIAGNGIDSLAEYWEEISYGDVTISGDVTDWINLPWRITRAVGTEGFIDLNNDDRFSFGVGEEFRTDRAMVLVDIDGDGEADNADFPFAQGGRDTIPGTDTAVWMPGERFADIDGDGMWDGLDEARNEMDFFTFCENDPDCTSIFG